jgi:cob(I)alamin adenosyltransferase
LKIYTKTGDRGETSLFGGKRVSKNDPRIEAYGTVDELNSVIGIVRSVLSSHLGVPGSKRSIKSLDMILGKIQNSLFVLGADLAAPGNIKSNAIRRISSKDCIALEKLIDEIEVQLPTLKSFVIPGGSKEAALLHFARTVCRRAERHVVAIRKETSEHTIIFLNRLSDLLFVLARYANIIAGVKDVPWKARSKF